MYICSVQSQNLCNLEIVLRILRMLRLSGQSRDHIVSRVQSRDCVTRVCNLEIA